MLSIGSKLTVTFTDLAFGGEGVARTPDGIIFVPLTAIGDEAVVEVIEVRKNYARGKLVELVTPGPGRTEPVCPHFGVCGGCQYQHLDYTTEFTAKQQQLLDLLTRIRLF